MTTNTITDTLKDALAKHRHARQTAMGQPAIIETDAQVQAADQDYLAYQRQQAALREAAAEQELRIVDEHLATGAATITTLRQQLATEESRQDQLHQERASRAAALADLRPAPRRQRHVDFQDPTLDPDLPPAHLARMKPAAWRDFYQQAQARRAVSAIVRFDEIHGWLLGVEWHLPDPRSGSQQP